jgi:hypothetical protein
LLSIYVERDRTIQAKSGETAMIGSNHQKMKSGDRTHRGREMIRETEKFLNRQPDAVPIARRCHADAGQLRGDPSAPARDSPAQIARTSAGPITPINTLIHVPADELGELNESLLDHWSVHLSRLIDMPHRGHVLLDLTDVACVPARFIKVYEWFCRHLAYQGRQVVLHIHGACLENPRPDELLKFLHVNEPTRPCES